ncbi:hypothetical protein B0G81_4336 [Paraburkholderia sp. BL6665CI2N2]|uniref:hypothetical protein n=1 Tax=Paraburkholderia sp. BL6665CI2N2 TaxID=1938806 RepID=UPI0010661D97|nr:hypothetical protein [Paraburkholderia sp. BL6665CI2N2]TDY23934.1 hypothetical protein B0G81_4336 [Paraburkholderia sp. BL6665CI2N2]
MRLNLFNQAKFTAEDEKKVRDLLSSPELEKILDRVEQSHIEERVSLRKQLDSIDKRHDPAINDAAAARLDAGRKLDAARAQFEAAKEAEKNATQAVDVLERGKQAEDYNLRKQLIETRDTRLDDFRLHVDNAWQQARHMGSITAVKHKSWTGHESIEYVSNTDKVNACMALLTDARADIEAMTLLPLTRAEVSERLTAWTHKLEPSLDAFGIACPRLDEKGEVTTHRPPRKLHEVLQDNGVAEKADIPPEHPKLERARSKIINV